MQDLIVKIKYTQQVNFVRTDGIDFELKKANPTDSGFDLQSSINAVLQSGERKIIPSGIHLCIPEGWEAQVRSRSGLSIKNALTVLNSPGTIDHLYRKEIGVILVNNDDKPFYIEQGMKIAQLCFSRVPTVLLVEEDFDDTERGGFGSTGV